MLNNLNVAITRPKQQGLQLQQALAEVSISSICQPLFDYQLSTSKENILDQISSLQPKIIIFVSIAAVKYADQALSLPQWLNNNQQVFAVGEKTQQALAQLGIQAICPTKQNSEGLLSLAQLSKQQLDLPPNKTNILIVRGDGGRELLADELKSRGANVQYLESYQRIWQQLSAQQLAIWRDKKINTIVITSNALLKRVVDLLGTTDNYWQNTCLWIVASERISQTAQQLGLKNVINAHGADHQSIVTTLLNMEPEND